MKIQQDRLDGLNVIRSYGAGYVVVNETTYRSSVIVAPDRVQSDWGPQASSELGAGHMSDLLVYKPEVVLLGTGARLRFPSAECTRTLVEAGVGVEVMDTGAACRTYNILVSEGRAVVAALLVAGGET